MNIYDVLQFFIYDHFKFIKLWSISLDLDDYFIGSTFISLPVKLLDTHILTLLTVAYEKPGRPKLKATQENPLRSFIYVSLLTARGTSQRHSWS